MADFKGVNSTLAATKAALIQHGLWDAKVRVHMDSYTTTGEAVADRIFVNRLEPLATYLGAEIDFEALGTSTTLSLGDAGSATRFMAATATNAAGTARARAIAGMHYRNTTQDPIPLFLTVGGAQLTAGRLIKVTLFTARA